MRKRVQLLGEKSIRDIQCDSHLEASKPPVINHRIQWHTFPLSSYCYCHQWVWYPRYLPRTILVKSRGGYDSSCCQHLVIRPQFIYQVNKDKYDAVTFDWSPFVGRKSYVKRRRNKWEEWHSIHKDFCNVNSILAFMFWVKKCDQHPL